MTHPIQAAGETQQQPTLGEYRVGISFNPGGNQMVNEIKRRAADFIDYCNEARVRLTLQNDPEVLRLMALAQTHIEDAAMWAVKAVTKPKRA